MHYSIIVIAVFVIVYFQILFFRKNIQKQKELKDIFPDKGECDSEIFINNENENPIIDVQNIDFSNRPVFENIVSSINGYLCENKGAVSDFHLIKDIVDRNCDCVEEEVATLTPIPLYLGLIGTMIGILVGVGFLVLSGGIDALISTQDVTGGKGIVELLGGVSLAMISSICGIFFTTVGSYIYKNSKTELNREKNAFLSWIQVNLLPFLSNNATSAIYTLQHNLCAFNNNFASNIKEMGAAFANANQSHQDQLKLMQLVEKMDVTRMAKANVQVLQELQNNTHEFEKFNQYLHSVTGYLELVQTLSKEVNEHLSRTKVIEDMGQFFKDEINQIEDRKGAISRTVGQVDVTLQNALLRLQESTEKQLNEFIKLSVTQQDKFSKTIEEQRDTLSTTVEKQQEQFSKVIEDQKDLLQQRMEETSILITELKNLTAVKESMSEIEKSTSEQNKRIADLTSAIVKLAQIKINTPTGQPLAEMPLLPKWLKISVISAMGIISVAGLIFIISQIIHYI